MSLTSFISQLEIKERFLGEFEKPRIVTDLKLLAIPQSNRYSLIGTAFDYLLRFYIQYLNPKAKQRPWVAEAGLKKLGKQTISYASYDVDTEGLSSDDDGSLEVGQRILVKAQAAHRQYIESGLITDSLLKSVIGLAQLDVIFRSGFVDENLGIAHGEDVRDLRKLISLVNPEMFRAKRNCFLNPTFGVGSKLIGGADADLLIDGVLIDIKATKNIAFNRDDFNQLIGYLAMHEIWGVNDLKRKSKVSKVGFYFARYGSLQTFDVKEIVDSKRFPHFLKWFKTKIAQRAKRHNPVARKRASRLKQS
jgi:hypothetical protein